MKKQVRKKKDKKKSPFDLDVKDLKEYLKQVPEVIFLIFMIWFGYSIISNPSKNELYQKYLKKSLIQGRKYIDNYFPGYLSSEQIFNKFDYDVLFVKTKEIITCLGGIYLAGALMLLIFTSKWRKVILFISLLLDLSLVHNLIYYRNERLFDIILIIFYLIILLCL